LETFLEIFWKLFGFSVRYRGPFLAHGARQISLADTCVSEAIGCDCDLWAAK
jgi:hypothetical protein